MKRIVIFSVLVCLFGACVSPPPVEEKAAPPFHTETVEVTPEPELPPEPEKAPEPVNRFPSSDGLDSPQFKNLPPEAADYLKTLARAFREKDREFLVSQGEGQYEKELRFRYEEEVYLAMLYRAGIYSEETHENPLTFPRLEYSRIQTIEYYEWEEKGPILEIAGLIYLEDGTAVACGINLIWRLIEPKILGAWPDKAF